MIKGIEVDISTIDKKTVSLNAIENDWLSKYEILLPKRYKIVYGGMEHYEPVRISPDLDLDGIKACKKEFNGKIVIINLEPKVYRLSDRLMYDNSDADFLRFAKIVDGCSQIIIEIDKKSYRIKNAKYDYTINPEDTNPQFVLLFDPELPEDYLIRKKNK